MKLYITQNFKVDKKDLTAKNPEMEVRLYLRSPSLKDFLKFKPKERQRRIQLNLKEKYRFLRENIPKTKFKRIGSKQKPKGIALTLKYKDLLNVKKLNCFSTISIINIKGYKKKKSKFLKQFISVKARIIIQVEGLKKGYQKYEDKIILVKATSFKNAERRVIKELKRNQPYLNPYGYLVRWKFEKILDSYKTYIEDKTEFDLKYGVEIFSQIKKRKLKSKHIWKKQWKKNSQ